MSSFTLSLSRGRAGVSKSLRTGGAICAIALFSIVLLSLASWDLFVFLLTSAAFFAALCLARPFSGRALVSERESFLSASLVIWVYLMVSEVVFTHNQTTESAVRGNVDQSAIYQALSWILSFAALAVVSCFRPAYLRRLFAGPLKWPSLFAIVVVASCPLSPKPLYSLALAFKLCTILLTLFAIGDGLENEKSVTRFYAVLFCGIFVIVMKSFITPLFAPNSFQDGRLGAMVGLSGTCGMLLLLSVLFLWLHKNPWFLFCGLFSITVMMLAGTKGGMLASFVSLMLFFCLLKRPVQALVVSLIFTIVFLLCVAFTPLGRSLQRYTESGNTGTLTGRTNLWNAVWPEIEKHPVLGHGYRASRFVSAEVEGAFTDAGNMHNSFLEVLYNNGLAGLIPVAVMSVTIILNLKNVIVRPPTLQTRYFAAAALALYAHLFVWGLVAATFGGAPDDRFMIFFGVFLLSVFLRAQSDPEYRNKIYGQHGH